MITRINKYWTDIDGRMVGTANNPCVILTREESLTFAHDDALQAECALAARAAGVLDSFVACHTMGGPVLGTVNTRPNAAEVKR